MKLCALILSALHAHRRCATPPLRTQDQGPCRSRSLLQLLAYRLLRWRMSDFMVYSKANTAGICRPGFTVLVFLASNNNNNSNDDCQQQQQQQTSVPECDRPLFPFANLLASFECHFCPCGLRHFNFNLMQATNKQIKRPNAPYEYES